MNLVKVLPLWCGGQAQIHVFSASSESVLYNETVKHLFSLRLVKVLPFFHAVKELAGPIAGVKKVGRDCGKLSGRLAWTLRTRKVGLLILPQTCKYLGVLPLLC